MLVLSGLPQDRIWVAIDGEPCMEVVLIRSRDGLMTIGIEAPANVSIVREKIGLKRMRAGLNPFLGDKSRHKSKEPAA